MNYTSYNKNERGFTKFNKNQQRDKNAMTQHIARLYMMREEERGRFISLAQAIEETDY
mgnify:CR=1 FL=1|jgi:hypothetical protein